MTKRLISNAKILNKKKKKIGVNKFSSFIRRIVKLTILMIFFAIIIFALQKYKIIPAKYSMLINSFGEKVISNVNNSLDIKLSQKSPVEEENPKIAEYDFEYKYWALNYNQGEENENATTSEKNVDDEDTKSNNSTDGQTEGKQLNNIQSTSKSSNSQDNTNNETSAKYVLPVFGKLVSGFGLRTHPIKGTKEFHEGVDLAANSGTPIKAFYGGVVASAGFDGSYGNNVRINHESGIQSLYAHCSKLIVKSGQIVKVGQIIAYVGSTGSANGPHLHFEIIKNKIKTDPKKYLHFN